MSNILTITLPEHLDEEKINVLIASSDDPGIEILNQYANNQPLNNSVQLSDFSPEELEAFYIVLNKITAPIEAGTYVFKVLKEEKTISLYDSYSRIEGAPAVPVGTAINMRFEIPGFEENDAREIPLYFKNDFNPADLLLLEEIGVTIAGDGVEFTISNQIECRISFSQPDGSEVIYIFDFPNNEIIPADE